MLNVLKQTAIYTGIYFIFLAAYWVAFLTILFFWKPLVTFFIVMFAWFGYQYAIDTINARKRAKLRQSAEDFADFRHMSYGSAE